MVAAEFDTGTISEALVSHSPGKNIVGYRELMSFPDFVKLWGTTLNVPTRIEYGEIGLPDEMKAEITDVFAAAEELGYWVYADKGVIHPKDLGLTSKELGTVEGWIKAHDWTQILNQ